jgi:phage regulator Rha-like protein
MTIEQKIHKTTLLVTEMTKIQMTIQTVERFDDLEGAETFLNSLRERKGQIKKEIKRIEKA